jgi:hypothetical protein
VAVFLVGNLAVATPSLQTAMLAHYPFIRDTPIDSCTTCHMPVKADFLNAYGLALRDAEVKFEELDNLDSDGDGLSNLDEIKNGTSPGSLATSPEYYIFHVDFSEDDPELGAVHFNHEMHVVGESFLSKGKCKNCHGQHQFPKEYNDNVSIRPLAHQLCWRCHETSGSQLAPKDCAGCHTGIKGIVEEVKERLEKVE